MSTTPDDLAHKPQQPVESLEAPKVDVGELAFIVSSKITGCRADLEVKLPQDETKLAQMRAELQEKGQKVNELAENVELLRQTVSGSEQDVAELQGLIEHLESQVTVLEQSIAEFLEKAESALKKLVGDTSYAAELFVSRSTQIEPDKVTDGLFASLKKLRTDAAEAKALLTQLLSSKVRRTSDEYRAQDRDAQKKEAVYDGENQKKNQLLEQARGAFDVIVRFEEEKAAKSESLQTKKTELLSEEAYMREKQTEYEAKQAEHAALESEVQQAALRVNDFDLSLNQDKQNFLELRRAVGALQSLVPAVARALEFAQNCQYARSEFKSVNDELDHAEFGVEKLDRVQDYVEAGGLLKSDLDAAAESWNTFTKGELKRLDVAETRVAAQLAELKVILNETAKTAENVTTAADRKVFQSIAEKVKSLVQFLDTAELFLEARNNAETARICTEARSRISNAVQPLAILVQAAEQIRNLEKIPAPRPEDKLAELRPAEELPASVEEAPVLPVAQEAPAEVAPQAEEVAADAAAVETEPAEIPAEPTDRTVVSIAADQQEPEVSTPAVADATTAEMPVPVLPEPEVGDVKAGIAEASEPEWTGNGGAPVEAPEVPADAVAEPIVGPKDVTAEFAVPAMAESALAEDDGVSDFSDEVTQTMIRVPPEAPEGASAQQQPVVAEPTQIVRVRQTPRIGPGILPKPVRRRPREVKGSGVKE